MTLVDINRLLEDVQTLNDMPPRLQKLEDAKVLSHAFLPARSGAFCRRVCQPDSTTFAACVDVACVECGSTRC